MCCEDQPGRRYEHPMGPLTPLPLPGKGAEVSHLEVLITGLLLAVAALGALACRLSVPYPIVLVIGGAVFAQEHSQSALRRFPSTFPHLSSGVAGYDYQVRRRGAVA
jgi:hypothetical protein